MHIILFNTFSFITCTKNGSIKTISPEVPDHFIMSAFFFLKDP